MPTDRVLCPRCGESLPPELDLCDACGFDLGARVAGHSSATPSREGPSGLHESRPAPGAGRGRSPGGPAPRVENAGVPGIAWLLLVVGLAVGGMIGFALRSAVAPRAESGTPRGPADLMAGGSGKEAQAGGAPQRMPAQIMQMVQTYKSALAKNPNDLEALVGLGNLEFDSGQWEKAIQYYSRALAFDSKNADVRVDRAIAYHATGQNDVAKRELLQVTREQPTHKNAWLNLGVVSRDLGDRAEAIRAWERYLELDPQGEHAEDVRQEIASLKQAG